MEFQDVMRTRRSIRDFSDQPVPEDVLNKLLELSLDVPSSSNTQPYKIAVATGEVCKQIGIDLVDKYQRSSAIQKQPLPKKIFSALTSGVLPDGDHKPILGKYPGEFQKRRTTSGAGLYDLLGIQRGDKAGRDEQMQRNFNFFDAPVAIFIFVHPGMTFTGLVDAGIWMQSLMLAATDEGLGTCAQGALGIWRSPVDKHFDIPKDYKLVCGLALGYPTDDKVNGYRPEKISLDELLIPKKV